MAQGLLQEVFTADEVARAAGVSPDAVQALVDAGDVRLIAGTPFISATDAVLIGRRLRHEAPAAALAVVPAAPAPDLRPGSARPHPPRPVPTRQPP